MPMHLPYMGDFSCCSRKRLFGRWPFGCSVCRGSWVLSEHTTAFGAWNCQTSSKVFKELLLLQFPINKWQYFLLRYLLSLSPHSHPYPCRESLLAKHSLVGAEGKCSGDPWQPGFCDPICQFATRRWDDLPMAGHLGSWVCGGVMVLIASPVLSGHRWIK